MYATRNFNFFESKSKKTNKKPTKVSNHSRSLSAKSDFTKNSARLKTQQNQPHMITLTKKQKQIREAIEYRYRKSKIREFVFEQGNRRSTRKSDRSHSSQMEQFRNLRHLKYVNLKQFHEKEHKKKIHRLRQQQQLKRSMKNRLKIKTDSSLIIKSQASQKSMDRLKFLKPYMQATNRTPTKKQDWKFISIQFKGDTYKSRNNNKSQKNQIKVKSHRTMTLQQKSRSKMKVSNEAKQRNYQFVPKLQDLNKLHQKYKF